MDFALTPEQEALQSSVRELVESKLPASYLNDCDAKGTYPQAAFDAMAGAGWLSLPFSSEVGGADGSVIDTLAMAEQLARSAGYDVSSGLGLSIFCGLTLQRYGTDEQKKRLLPAMIEGRIRFATCISEPDSGSDAAALKTAAVRKGNQWVVKGQKLYCTGASIPNTMLMVATRTSEGARYQDGISVILIDPADGNVEIAPLPSMGRGIMGTNIIYIDGATVDDSALVGPEGQGWKVVLSGLNFERMYVSAAYVGAAQAAVDEALIHAGQREQFGKPIGSHQVIAHSLADMQTQVDAARLLVYRAGAALDDGVADPTRFISQAKLFASEVFQEVTRRGLQIMGGQGYMSETSMQRHLRDAVSTTLTAGTSEIHRTIIARKLGVQIPFA